MTNIVCQQCIQWKSPYKSTAYIRAFLYNTPNIMYNEKQVKYFNSTQFITLFSSFYITFNKHTLYFTTIAMYTGGATCISQK